MGNKSVPEIRFAGFTDSWEQRELVEELSLLKDGTHGTHKDVKDGPYLLSAKNIKNGYVNIYSDDRKISLEEYNHIHKNFDLKVGDVLLTIVGSIGEAAILRDPTNITFQRSVAYLRPSTMNSEFLYSLIIGSKFQKELKNRQVLSAQPGIYLGDLAKVNLSIPKNIKEQEKIGSFFKEIDNLITLHQRKLDNLKNVKAGLLQKMFPKNGEDFPEIRFPGFTDAWEQRKLGELCDEFRSGKNIKSEDISDEGEYPVFGGNGLRGYTRTYNHDGLYAIIGRQGAQCGNMNISYGKAYFTEHAIAVKGNKNNDTSFLFYLLSKMNLGQYSGQSAQPGLAVNKLIELSAFIPTFKEQVQISTFFKNLDSLITLHQRELDALKGTKQAFLQKMFV